MEARPMRDREGAVVYLPHRREDKLPQKSYDVLSVTPAFPTAEARRLAHPFRFVLKAGAFAAQARACCACSQRLTCFLWCLMLFLHRAPNWKDWNVLAGTATVLRERRSIEREAGGGNCRPR
jgi:hypothetical protein